MRATHYVAIQVAANMCNFSRRLWMEANSPPEARGKQVAAGHRPSTSDGGLVQV